jgi:hypothetical protein
VYYQKYLDQVDECMSVSNNPVLAGAVCDVLREVKELYKNLNYNASYFEGHFNTFYEILKLSASSGNLGDLLKNWKSFDHEDFHSDLQSLSIKLDRLSKIYLSEDDEELKRKISNLLREIKNERHLSYNNISEYKVKVQYLIDEHNYSTNSVTKVIEKKQKTSGCMIVLIFVIPIIIKSLISLGDR